MPTPKQMEKLAVQAARRPALRPLRLQMRRSRPNIGNRYSKTRAPRRPGPEMRQRCLSEIRRHVLRISCRRCERTVEIETADAVRLYGANAVRKDVAQRLLGNTCQQRTGRHEEDGFWPALDTP
ncbi:hypothetical protein [Bradyrhizobium sp. RT4b]|uniref:hypothetical protein n=1 Tax=Bradyrhizobium sp. RT4b TaxID=3156379 RepID=UPI00339163EA